MLESQYLTAVYGFKYFGPVRTSLLLSYFKSAENIWNSDTRELSKTGLSKEKVAEFDKYRKTFDIPTYFERLKKLGVKIATFNDKKYPENLKGLEASPCVLYYKGLLKRSDVNSLAIVGSRRMSWYGKKVATTLSAGLASKGITIVSGLARGIDTVSHQSALDAGGRTIAVLGHGLDRIYPYENTDLARKIVESGGALVSEYPLDYPTLPENFVNRNRIISGMVKGVIVVEGAEKSGTLTTASHAAQQGKTVFAVPGPITSPNSFAPHLLLKNGAIIATNVTDVLEELKH